jgi:trehalose/maltose transport system permease protein
MIRLLKILGLTLLVLGLLAFTLFPFYYALVSSFQTGAQLFTPQLWPEQLHPANYLSVFAEQPFGTNIANSVIVASLVVLLSLVLACSASYALSRIQFRGRALLLMAFLGVSMFPQVAVLSGMFELIRSLGLYNDLAGLALAYMLFTLPFTIWVLTSFMRTIPRELEQAAVLDGATPWTILVRIFLPMLRPALVSTGLLAFIAAWNEFLFALTFTLSNEQRTVPVAIALISGASQHELPWGQVMAASVVVTLPLVILVVLFQHRILAGLSISSSGR